MNWIRALVMFTALAGRAAAIVTKIVRREALDPILISSIGGVYALIYPDALPWSRRGQPAEETDERVR